MISGWKFKVGDKTYELELDDVTGVEAREFRQAIGVPLSLLDEALKDGTLDTLEALAAVRWLLDRRENPLLTFLEVLSESTYSTYKSLPRTGDDDESGDASPPPEAAATEVAAGHSGDIRDQAVGVGSPH